MNICIPVEEEQGLQSKVSEHFGSAPVFVIVDTETREVQAISNMNRHHAHGACRPLISLAGKRLDGVVVGGIGKGALSKLRAADIKVFLSDSSTVGEAVDALEAGTLQQVTPKNACGHHGRGAHGSPRAGQREQRGQRGGQTGQDKRAGGGSDSTGRKTEA